MQLCLRELVEITCGSLRLAEMPPRDGDLTCIGRIGLSASTLRTGDVFWQLQRVPGDVELAYLRGAIGVVSAPPAVPTWPGRFAVLVNDPLAALDALVHVLAKEGFGEEADPLRAELKDLQLCAALGVDIYPPAERRCHSARR